MNNVITNAGTLAALKAARQFIVNGTELGFIRMPDAETPDPAHDTLAIIERAIADLEAKAQPQTDQSKVKRTYLVSYRYEGSVGRAFYKLSTDDAPTREDIEAWEKRIAADSNVSLVIITSISRIGNSHE
jgi:hypothetical protein